MRKDGSGTESEFVAGFVAVVLLLVAMGFGGGSRGAGDGVVHLVAVPAIWLGVARWRYHQATRLQRAFLYLLLGAMSLAALQLVPLPPSWFSALPLRPAVIGDLAATGLDAVWVPMTLDRWGTVRAMMALATFAASWMLASTLTADARERLLKVALIATAAMALLGFAQAAAGTHSPLRFYDYHHPIGAIGTFANRNHFGDLLAMLLPFSLAFGVIAQRRSIQAGVFFWYGLAVVVFLAAALSYSRTGFALACMAVVASVLVLPPAGQTAARTSVKHAAPWLAGLSGVLAVGYYAWGGIVRRLEQDPLDDLRWQYVEHGLAMARAYLPWGSGLGSFRDAYAPFEPIAAMGSTHALHAHNDLLQVATEAGIPGLLILVALGGLVLAAARAAVRDGRATANPLLGAAAVAAFVPLAHSLVDYPLRTLSIGVVFGLVVAVLTAPNRRRGPGPILPSADVRGAGVEGVH